MSNRKINTSSAKRPSPRGGVNNNNFVDLTAFGFSVTKKPRTAPSGSAAAAGAGGVVDLLTIASSSTSSESSDSGSSIVAIVNPREAAASRTKVAARSKSSSSPTSDVEYIGTTPPPSATKQSRLFKHDPSPPHPCRLGLGGVVGVGRDPSAISATGHYATAASASSKKVASSPSAKEIEMSNQIMTAATTSSGAAAAANSAAAASLGINSSFASARTSLSSSSSSSSSSRAALLDLTMDNMDSSSNQLKKNEQQQEQEKRPIAKLRPSTSLAGGGVITSTSTIPNTTQATTKTMTTLSDVGNSFANGIRFGQQNELYQTQQQQQQQQQKHRRAKRDKHPAAATDAHPNPSDATTFEDTTATAPTTSSAPNDYGHAMNAPSTATDVVTSSDVPLPMLDAPVDDYNKMENDVVQTLEENNRSTARNVPNIPMEQNNQNGANATNQIMSLEAASSGITTRNGVSSFKVKREPTVKNEDEEEEEVKPQNHENTLNSIIDRTTDVDSTSIAKGDYVKVFYDATDMFGDMNLEWYLGIVTSVKVKPNQSHSYNIRVRFVGDDRTKTLQYPAPYVEKLLIKDDLSEVLYPETFHVGDVVDALFQDGKINGKWYRGRIASVDNERRACDVMYYDGDYESNIPVMEKKIRLIQRCDESNGEWLVEKQVSFSRRGSVDDPSQTGTVSKKSGTKFLVSFCNGSKKSVCHNEAVAAVFRHHRMSLPSNRKHEWPGAIATDDIETIRSRRRKKEEVESHDDCAGPKPSVKAESVVSKGRTKSSRSTASAAAVNRKLSDPHYDANLASYRGKDGDDFSELYIPIQCLPAVDVSVLEMRKTANDFPPGLPNMLWCALNSPEAQTGTNFLLELLFVHDSIPPTSLVQKLMDLMKYGPKADGANIYFKDPHRTELAAQFVYSLVGASYRLQRRDSAVFGPSSWDDIEALFLQSVNETGNSAGHRLAHGLQLAARGAKLLSMMFLSELQGCNLYSTSSDVLRDPAALNAMPTVRTVKAYGIRSGLKIAVEHMTKCLVLHSRWIMDSGGIELTTSKSRSDESCCLEARVCLDSLGSVTCFIAWLFCVEENIKIMESAVAFVIKDAFLAELERSMADIPQLGNQKKEDFVRKCKTYFVMSFAEEFASPLVMTLGNMIGVEEDLALVGLLP